MEEKPKQPIIGFAGLAVLVLGLVIACGGGNWGYGLAAAGGLVLAYALFTGNIKFLG